VLGGNLTRVSELVYKISGKFKQKMITMRTLAISADCTHTASKWRFKRRKSLKFRERKSYAQYATIYFVCSYTSRGNGDNMLPRYIMRIIHFYIARDTRTRRARQSTFFFLPLSKYIAVRKLKYDV